MARAPRTRGSIVGNRYGKLEVIALSDKRGSRGARTVPLWECRCDCGAIAYKATDTLTNGNRSMCSVCAGLYAAEKGRANSGYVEGTQLSRIRSTKTGASNTSGVRGVYFDKHSGKWRARLKFKGHLMNFGSFESFEDAVSARRNAELEYFGEFLQEIDA